MLLHKVIFFGILIKISSCYQKIHPSNIQKNISINTTLLEIILQKYLSDQESISFFNLKMTKIIRNSTMTETSFFNVLERIKSIYIFKNIDQKLVNRINDMGDELKQPSVTKAYITVTSSKELLSENLKYLTQINSNGKWIFALGFMSSSDVEEILTKAWEHKMSNILAVSEKVGEYFVTMYNPFDRSENSVGKFYEIKISEKYLGDIISLMNNFSKRYGRKISNFHMVKAKLDDFHNFGSFADRQMEELFEFVMKTRMNCIALGATLGTKFDNGTLTGDLKLIYEGKVDIVFVNRLVAVYGTKNSTFLNPIAEADMLFIIKKHKKDISRLDFHVICSFDKYFRVIYIFIFITLVAIIHSQTGFELSESLIKVVSILSLVSLPSLWRMNQTHQRFTIGFLWIFSVIVCGAFQGLVVSKLNSDETFREMNTLSELVNSEYDLKMMTHVQDPFKPVDGRYINDVYRKLHEKTMHLDDFSAEMIESVLERPNQALLSEK